ncbi:MAG: T9SS type A sorting domain-containing protein [Ignavibacteriales bacterium]|nr:T9SS type A sorting domain-containing protein [Ignavibacteriales bacterium]MCF8305879.1 T9SS type A sorting domain-containing protein [Ignavibacteriales bacterium]MCF8315600.1 T9SS type A sorting domain-containing protein [Ignavibacteriales bacterium]MCF8437206.1 T9SS type A sorting domain-containing protein [Ignavibacteriales bacterium]
MKKLQRFSFILFLLNSLYFAQIAIPPTGMGTPENPYQIASLENLYWIAASDEIVPLIPQATRWSMDYIQTADIDASATATWFDNGEGGYYGWSPIGSFLVNFVGSYNGNGHTIGNLYINRPSTSKIGLFSYVSKGEITNLGLESVNLTGKYMVAALIGNVADSSLISNCYSTGDVRGQQSVGGLLALISLNVTVMQSYSTCSVLGSYAGGFAASIGEGNSLISECYSTGDVTGSDYIGGFIGQITAAVENCYSRGNVTLSTGGSQLSVGAFAGYVNEGSLRYCYCDGDINYTGTSNPTDRGFVGNNSNGSYTANFFDSDESNQSTATGATAKSTTWMKTGENFIYTGWDPGSWRRDDDINDGYLYLYWQNIGGTTIEIDGPTIGDGSTGNPYQIASLENLYWITATDAIVTSPDQISRWGYNYIQTANINAETTSEWNDNGSGSYYGWSPIGNNSTKFTGSYNGGGYSISGLYINRPETDYIGFFGFINNSSAVISNLGLPSVDITGQSLVGAICSYLTNGASVINCYSTGNISGRDAGGLVGYIRSGSYVTKSFSSCNVTGADLLGGFASDVNNNGSYISECYSTGNVTGESSLGGFVGYTDIGSKVENCYSRGNVDLLSNGSVTYVGAFTGFCSNGQIKYSYCTGNVTKEGAAITTSRGFVGTDEGSVTYTANYFDSELSNQSSGIGATAKSTSWMQTSANFITAGWDQEIWNRDNEINDGYLYLDWQNPGGTPLPVELKSFTAKAVNSKVILKWSTATEVNNYGFEIERSKDKKLQSWETIGFVNGHGNSNSPKEYIFSDNYPLSGNTFYRLKQIDIDGAFKYSDIISVESGKTPSDFSLHQNYPNPFNPATKISFNLPQASDVSLKVYDILGNQAAVLVNRFLDAGSYSYEFDGAGLSSGIYFYRIKAGNFNSVKKMVLLR